MEWFFEEKPMEYGVSLHSYNSKIVTAVRVIGLKFRTATNGKGNRDCANSECQHGVKFLPRMCEIWIADKF